MKLIKTLSVSYAKVKTIVAYQVEATTTKSSPLASAVCIRQSLYQVP